MKTILSHEERSFLLGLIKEHREYYQTLASNSHCSARNREKFEFIERLWTKLSEPNRVKMQEME